MSAVAQYQVQRQQHTALDGLVIAGDHIPARLERKDSEEHFLKFLRHLLSKGTGCIRRCIWISEKSLENGWAAQ